MDGSSTGSGRHLELVDDIERLLDVKCQRLEARMDKDLALLRYHVLCDNV